MVDAAGPPDPRIEVTAMIRNSTKATPTLEEVLGARTASAHPDLVRPVEGREGWLRCLACGHRCRIPPGRPGICKVRANRNGDLRVPFDYVAALAVDPIEKKPFFHALPGSTALSFGMLGCDLHCGYCQNWFTSQALRDPSAVAPPQDTTAEALVRAAVESGSRSVVSTYNEPLITSEWARAVFERARPEGLRTGYVSNGNATPEVLDFLRPVTDLFKVDLKGFNDRAYRSLGAVLGNVLDTIEQLKSRGFWVEVVTLLVPGFNDSEEELRALTGWLAGVDPLTPWHVSAFHADYRMSGTRDTRIDGLLRAAEIGTAAGLRYVYAGNLPGRVNTWEDTRCHGCGRTVIRRQGFRVLADELGPEGVCPGCGTRIPGVWN
jgi:pyruvate formate lyase activating enzyme